MKFSLKDGAPRKPGEAELFVSKNSNTLEIGMTGQEDSPPVVIEHYDGIVKVRVFGSSDSSPDYIRVITDGGLGFIVNNPGALAIDPASLDGPGRPTAYPAKIVPVLQDKQPKRMVSIQPVVPKAHEYQGVASTGTVIDDPIVKPPFEPVSYAKKDPDSGMFYGRNLTDDQLAYNKSLQYSGRAGTRVERPVPITQAEVDATLAKGTNGNGQHDYRDRTTTYDPYANEND